jgi:hypothetical protein
VDECCHDRAPFLDPKEVLIKNANEIVMFFMSIFSVIVFYKFFTIPFEKK